MLQCQKRSQLRVAALRTLPPAAREWIRGLRLRIPSSRGACLQIDDVHVEIRVRIGPLDEGKLAHKTQGLIPIEPGGESGLPGDNVRGSVLPLTL
jgi:hypothetical protein